MFEIGKERTQDCQLKPGLGNRGCEVGAKFRFKLFPLWPQTNAGLVDSRQTPMMISGSALLGIASMNTDISVFVCSIQGKFRVELECPNDCVRSKEGNHRATQVCWESE